MTDYAHTHCQAAPEQRSPRARRDEVLSGYIQRVWEDNFQVYGARKVWRQLLREGVMVALHGGASDAATGPTKCPTRQTDQDHDQRQRQVVPAGQGQPPVPR